MIHYALHTYVPKRYIRRASFEAQDVSRMILGFKDGRNVYTRWAVRQFAKALAGTDLSGITLVAIPASTHYSNVRRWKRFLQLMAKATGATSGFEHVAVCGNRKRAHVTREYELATNVKRCIRIDADFFRGRKVLVIDDIYTTGLSSQAFIGAMEAHGAVVQGALFLARTMSRRAM